MAKSKSKEKERAKERERERERDDRPDRPKPRTDAYVMMLLITFFAIVAGCVLLYLDNEEYGSKSPPKEVAPTLPDLGKGETKAAEPKT
jgi:hypothetical protein